MAITHWGIIARSASTGIQIRKKLDQAHDTQADAANGATAWQTELNTEKKFGLEDWICREDHTEGGPHEDNQDPLKGPAAQQPNAFTATTGQRPGMSGLLF